LASHLNQAIIVLRNTNKNIVGNTEGNIVGHIVNRLTPVFSSPMLVGEINNHLHRKLAENVGDKLSNLTYGKLVP